METLNRAKAALLYGTIDHSGFYRNPVAVEARSWMNVPFTLPNAELDKPFLEGARKAGLVGLEGHRSVGGMRALDLQRDAACGRAGAGRLHERIPAEPRLRPAPCHSRS